MGDVNGPLGGDPLLRRVERRQVSPIVLTVGETDHDTLVDRAWKKVAAGGVIAIPTDTVYGIACSLASPTAIARIFEIKRRPRDKPLPVLLSSIRHLHHVSPMSDRRITEFALRYWPGPLTIVVSAKHDVPPGVIGPGQTVGVRVPGHRLARDVIERTGGCLAVTSANRSGLAPARTGAEVMDQFGHSIDLVLDDGSTGKPTASTVVAFNNDDLVVLREGVIPATSLHTTWRQGAGG